MKIVPADRYFWRERWPARHHNPHKNVVMRNVKPTPKAKPENIELETGAGSRDDVWVFRSGPRVYVMALNQSLNYVGLAEYDLRGEPTERRQSLGWKDYVSLEPVGEVFTQTDHEIESILGPRGLTLPPSSIAMALRGHLPE